MAACARGVDVRSAGVRLVIWTISCPSDLRLSRHLFQRILCVNLIEKNDQSILPTIKKLECIAPLAAQDRKRQL
jgi:hypothetical protein